MTRYIIIGTGAVGGVVGGELARHGLDVVWVARGDHGAALAQRGMTLRTPGGTYEVHAPVWSGPGDAHLTAGDVLVLATKTQSAERAASEWCDVPVAGGGTAGEALPILVCTNGLAAEDLVSRYFARVYGVCVWCPALYLSPGEIVARFAPRSAAMHLSRVPASLTTDADRQLLAGVAGDWRSANLDAFTPDDVLPWKRRKLVTNMGNVVDALLGPGADRDAKRAANRALEAEAYAVLADAGLEVTPDADEAAVRQAGPKIAPVEGFDKATMGNSSTWQSLAKGDALETDYLTGEVVRLAHSAGRQAPLNATVSRLAREAARDGRRPGDLSGAELVAALGLSEGLPTTGL